MADPKHHTPDALRSKRPMLPEVVQMHLGEHLKAFYASAGLASSQRLDQLLNQLEAVLAARGEALTVEVRAGLVAAMPKLRLFAMSLARDPMRADDLVQETLKKGWKSRHSFYPGSNLEAWLFTILRNTFYTHHRKGLREEGEPHSDWVADQGVPATQDDQVDLQDVHTVLQQLPRDQREVMNLIVLNEMTYEEAARITGCKIGTIKSRLFRARAQLIKQLGYDASDIGASNFQQAATQTRWQKLE